MKNSQPPPLREHLQLKIELKRNVLGCSLIWTFRIFVVVFYRQAHLKKSKQIFEIQHVQIDEIPSKEVCNGGVACSQLDGG